MNPTVASDRRFVATSVLSALAFLAVLLGLSLRVNEGAFDYPLDDVYIHLAMAQGIAAGGYGVNAAEYTSAASSALYPLLLLPIVPPEIQRLLPLFWNIVGLVLSAVLWARLLLAGGYGAQRLRPVGMFLAATGPVALLMSSTAFLGMEHTLHAAASLAILLGLVLHFQGITPWWLLFAGIVISPILRYEGLALATIAAGIIFITGHQRRGLIALALGLMPLVAFTGFLVSIGLDPLPNSVLAKQLAAAAGDLGPVQNVIAKFRNNIGTGGGAILLALILAIVVVFLLSIDIRRGRYRLLALALILSGMGHLMFGQVGWMNRYEHYILVVLSSGLLVLLSAVQKPISKPVIGAFGSVIIAAPTVFYLPEIITDFPVGARAVHHQQGQMSDFAKQHLNAPIAVNDIGWVAWNNQNYVLDLWGLASSEALELRLGNSAPGWAGPLAIRHNAPVAMIYDNWLDNAVGPNWVRLGEFRLKELRGFLGSGTVAFYATAPQHVDQVRRALDSWVPQLHPLTYFEYSAVSE